MAGGLRVRGADIATNRFIDGQALMVRVGVRRTEVDSYSSFTHVAAHQCTNPASHKSTRPPAAPSRSLQPHRSTTGDLPTFQ